MNALFVLLPEGTDLEAWVRAAPAAMHATLPHLHLRRYPRADGPAHLLSLVRAGGDPVATRWLRGTVWAVFGGAMLGAVVNGVLGGAFGMFGGLLELAIPLGLVLGAFLGGFTAAMTGTEVARDEVKRLARHVQPGCVLLQVTAGDRARLEPLRALCEEKGLHHALA